MYIPLNIGVSCGSPGQFHFLLFSNVGCLLVSFTKRPETRPLNFKQNDVSPVVVSVNRSIAL